MAARYSLLVLLLAAASGRAEPGGMITDQDLKPHFVEQQNRLRQVQQGKAKAADLRRHYAQEADRRHPARAAAIHRFMNGMLLYRIGSAEDARREFERALELWTRFPPCHVVLANIYEEMGQIGAAKERCKQAQRLDGGYVPALNTMARLLMREKDLEGASRLFRRAMEVEVNLESCAGLANVCVLLWKQKKGSDEQACRRHLADAKRYAQACVDLNPKNGKAHIIHAETLYRLVLLADAARVLEKASTAKIPAAFQIEALQMLLAVCRELGDVKKVMDALKRLADREELKPEVRADARKKLEQTRELGFTAFVVWQIEQYLAVVRNDGLSPTVRRRALRALLKTYSSDDRFMRERKLAKVRQEIWETAFRVLVNGPPELATTMMQFLRTEVLDPRLIRIVVHFVYPNVTPDITPAVRVQAVRTLHEVAGAASLITLLNALKDDSGRVGREVDKRLSDLAQARGVVGDGIEPLTRAERRRARDFWRRWIHSEEGADLIIESGAARRECVDMDPKFNRSQRANPVADHVTNTILLDNQVAWRAWKPCYEFLAEYLNKTFRPPELRNKPVAPGERAAIVKELDEYWRGAADDAVDARQAGGPSRER